jgi:hypothetical protein
MVATIVLLLAQLPPVAVFERVAVSATHSTVVPVMGKVSAPIVTVAVVVAVPQLLLML